MQVSTAEDGVLQISMTQVRNTKIDTAEIGTVDPTPKSSTAEINTTQICLSKILSQIETYHFTTLAKSSVAPTNSSVLASAAAGTQSRLSSLPSNAAATSQHLPLTFKVLSSRAINNP